MKEKLSRIHELDLLRGFFIFVIVVDHFQRWPSAFSYLTGEGRLWVSAAEGFFIISGLLIGYLRGHKQRDKPFREVAVSLLKRAGLLYIWAVLITFLVVTLSVTYHSTDPLVPMGPNAEQTTSIATYVTAVLTQTYSNDWIFFLRLYAIMLLVSPIFIWLLRKGLWWVAGIISLSVYGLSFLFDVPEAAMQWQLLFFAAALIGFKLDSIRSWLHRYPYKKRLISGTIITITLITMVISYFWVFGWSYVESDGSHLSRDSYLATRGWLDPIFLKDPMMPARVILSFIWVGGLFAIIHQLRRPIMKWLGWFLMLFGQRSLSAYCLQAIFFIIIQQFIPISTDFWLNTGMTVIMLLVFWSILRIPIVQKILPK